MNSGRSSGGSSASAPLPVPLERGRAAGVLAGLIAFTAGFAAAALLVLAGYSRTPPYLVAVTVGLVGIGLVGYFYHRGTVSLPQASIWSPTLLRAVTAALNLPAVPIIAVLYVLAGIGLFGNLVVPVLLRR